MSEESVYTLSDPSHLLMFHVGEIINNGNGPGEIVIGIDPNTCSIRARKATRWLAFKSRVVQLKRRAWWRIRCAYYDLKDRF